MFLVGILGVEDGLIHNVLNLLQAISVAATALGAGFVILVPSLRPEVQHNIVHAKNLDMDSSVRYILATNALHKFDRIARGHRHRIVILIGTESRIAMSPTSCQLAPFAREIAGIVVLRHILFLLIDSRRIIMD